MRTFAALALAGILAGCGRKEAPVLPFKDLGAFKYEDKMELPAAVTKWNGKRVRATGFINPLRNPRNLEKFLLVKDRASCCFGRMPEMNHYIEVKLKDGLTTDYTTDPVTVQGVLVVEDRWDGDWPLGLYWMENAEVVH